MWQPQKFLKFTTSMILLNKVEIIERKKINDERGWFLKTLTGKEEGLPNHTGEIYVVRTYPGQIRGGHYHEVAKEWFTLLTGKATLRLKDTNTQEEATLELDADRPITVVIPAFIAHEFKNVSDDDFLLLAYTDVLYDPGDTIPFLF